MPGLSPEALALLLAAALTIWAAEGVVAGVKKVERKVQHVAAKIAHPFHHHDAPKTDN